VLLLGIGAGLVAAYRRQGWSVVANARTMKPAQDPDMLAVEGDIAAPATAEQIICGALERFGRIDTLVNNAGVFVSKPFTDYTAQDEAVRRAHRQHLGHYRGGCGLRLALGPGRADEGRSIDGGRIAGH
jgi:NAD(P)-dependent dehydrogenase (short-subunit alcohol dehydrogenase family)